MRILRENLQISDYQSILIPRDADLLHVAPGRGARAADETIDLWYLDRDTGAPGYHRGIYVIGTGNPMPREMFGPTVHLGTCVMPSGLVWHVFEGPLTA